MCWGKSTGKLYGNAVALKKLNFCVLRHTRRGSGRRAWWVWLVVRLVCRLGKQLNKLPQGAASLSYIYALHASYTSLCVCMCPSGRQPRPSAFCQFRMRDEDATAAARQLCKWQPSFLYTHMERAQVQANLEWVEEKRGERERQTSRLTLNRNLNLNRNQNEISTQSSCVLSIVVQYIIKSRGNYQNSKYF